MTSPTPASQAEPTPPSSAMETTTTASTTEPIAPASTSAAAPVTSTEIPSTATTPAPQPATNPAADVQVGEKRPREEETPVASTTQDIDANGTQPNGDASNATATTTTTTTTPVTAADSSSAPDAKRLPAPESLQLKIKPVNPKMAQSAILGWFHKHTETPLLLCYQPSGKHYAYIMFETEEEKAKAQEVLKTKKIFGRLVTVSDVTSEMDDRIGYVTKKDYKRKAEEGKSSYHERMASQRQKRMDNAPSRPLKTVSETVCPLATFDYSDQLILKQRAMKDVLKGMLKTVKKSNGNRIPEWITFSTDPNPDAGADLAAKVEKKGKGKAQTPSHKMICPMEDVVASPQTSGYRRKTEFTCGFDENKAPTVGFCVGSMKGMQQVIKRPENVPIIDPNDLALCSSMQALLDNSAHGPFDKSSKTGVWRILHIRSTTTNEVMVTVQINHRGLSPEDLDKVRSEAKSHFLAARDAGTIQISSLILELNDDFTEIGDNMTHESLFGEMYVTEKLLGLNFRISAGAFFQVNVPCAELLFKKIIDLAQMGPDDTVLDVCCGTGTIGQVMASHCKNVVGVELIEAAVKDARINAEANGIKNVTFIAGRVENELLPALYKYAHEGNRVIGIVDPPRAGLHVEVVKYLRGCKRLDRLVYVSCNPRALIENVRGFCCPTSNKYLGDPFRVVKAVPVDMFPGTPHCEMLVLFERYKPE
eukprot:TRINITY_DN1171_c0_g1_i2.p1 TRINITY_DN1171_c0_g1~~TRINITY_DN1171_c0_g1_i2.p1  ORF type:complete len:763 (+),score=129.87 TRINITY_DN1171_c0_g1_i2:177-2291(+)